MTDAIAPAGRWRLTLLEVGSSLHPGSWIGPGSAEWCWSPINALLLRSPEQIVLIDAGPGITGSWWPYEEYHVDILAALREHGVDAADVDLVALTHLDSDHAGGLLVGTWPDELGLVFPRARALVHEDAIAAARAADPDAPGNAATRLVALLAEAGCLFPVTDGVEVAPGLHIRSSPGHRAGHFCVEIDGPDPFVYVADALHNEAHVAHPEWDTSSDDDPALALETRRRVLTELAASGARAAITHMAGPGAFTVVDDGGALHLIPAHT